MQLTIKVFRCIRSFVVGTLALGTVCAQERGPLVQSAVRESDAPAIATETGADTGEVRQAIINGRLRAVYWDSDIRRLFPEISTDDKWIDQCFTSVTVPPTNTRFYVAESGSHTVNVKTLYCHDVGDERFCSLTSNEAFYSHDPKKHFFVEGMPLDEALKVVSLYKPYDAVVSALPIKRVSKVDDHYEFAFGNSECACRGTASVIVKSFLWLSWLSYLQTPKITCV
jgi:hypothetical protein